MIGEVKREGEEVERRVEKCQRTLSPDPRWRMRGLSWAARPGAVNKLHWKKGSRSENDLNHSCVGADPSDCL